MLPVALKDQDKSLRIMLNKLTTLILCLLAVTACSSVNTRGLTNRGVDTHDQTIPVYSTKW